MRGGRPILLPDNFQGNSRIDDDLMTGYAKLTGGELFELDDLTVNHLTRTLRFRIEFHLVVIFLGENFLQAFLGLLP